MSLFLFTMNEYEFPAPQADAPNLPDDTANVESNEAEQSAEETQETTSQELTRADLEQLLAERDAVWQQRLDTAKQEAQSKADRARNVALNKANAFEKEYVPTLKAIGIALTPEQVTEAKRGIIDHEFWQTETAPPPNTGRPVEMPTSAQTARRIVSRAELEQYVTSQGVRANEINLERYAGLWSDTPGALEALQGELNAAKQRRVEQSSERNVMQQFGNTSAAAITVRGGASNPEKEMEQLLNQDPSTFPGGVMAYERRMDALDAQLRKAGKWK